MPMAPYLRTSTQCQLDYALQVYFLVMVQRIGSWFKKCKIIWPRNFPITKMSEFFRFSDNRRENFSGTNLNERKFCETEIQSSQISTLILSLWKFLLDDVIRFLKSLTFSPPSSSFDYEVFLSHGYSLGSSKSQLVSHVPNYLQGKANNEYSLLGQSHLCYSVLNTSHIIVTKEDNISMVSSRLIICTGLL